MSVPNAKSIFEAHIHRYQRVVPQPLAGTATISAVTTSCVVRPSKRCSRDRSDHKLAAVKEAVPEGGVHAARLAAVTRSTAAGVAYADARG